MSEQEIIEGNKLIAEFMHYKENGMFIWNNPPELISNNSVYIGYTEHSAKYHSSWDWLMPCIDKIYDDDLYSKYKETSGQFEKEIFINTKFIIETWLQVVEFIKWYNLCQK